MPSLAAVAKRLILAILAVNLAVALVVGLSLWQARVQTESEVRILARSVAANLDANLSGTISRVDLALLAVVDEARRELAAGGIDAGALNAYITRLRSRLPEVGALRATDPGGLAIYGPEIPPGASSSLAQRDYYKYLRDNRDDSLRFSEPLVGVITGKWMVLLVRRISNADGSFAGLVYAGLTFEDLTRGFSSFEVGPSGSISLRDSSLRLISRFPSTLKPADLVGRSDAAPRMRELVAAGTTAADIRVPPTGDRGGRLLAYTRVGSSPFYVSVSFAEKDYLARWYRSILELASAMVFVFLVTVVAAVLYYRSLMHDREAATMLTEQEEKYRTLADYTYDWEFWIAPSGSYIYVSPSCERITGYAAAEFYRDPAFMETIIHPDDLPAYRAHRHDAYRGDEGSGISYRIVQAGGEIRWIEHVCRPVISSSGAWLGTRGSNRDVTERKTADEKIRSLLGEKELILKEVHHRIKNNMSVVSSLLDIQAELESGGSPAEVLQTASNRVRSMAVLYDKLYRSETFTQLSLREYLSSLLGEVLSTFPESGKVSLSLDIEDIQIDSGKLSRLGLILNELITNSMKYAFADRTAGRITIAARHEGSQIRLDYSDDGVGLGAGAARKGFGMVLVDALTKQLGGSLAIDRGRARGMGYTINFGI